MNKINNLDEAILNIGKSRDNIYGVEKTNDVLYSRWDKRYSRTLGEFYTDFIELRLPDKEIVREWNKILLEYSQMKDAIFPIRDGHSDSKDDSKLKLRRGWLVKVDGVEDGDVEDENKFSYMFTDNHLAAYIYKMALDGYCPTAQQFYDFMAEFKEPANIGWLNGREVKNDSFKGQKRHFSSMPVHFGWIGKTGYPGNTESQKNVFINTSPAPTCPFGAYGYKHAHILGVKDGFYNVNDKDVKWKDIMLVELGEENVHQQDYQWDDTIKNFVWHREMKNIDEYETLRKVVVAHFLRFLNPMNHFLAPKQGCNKFTKRNKEQNGEYSLDIAEYKNLLSYLMWIRKKEFNNDYIKFENEALLPSCVQPEDFSFEEIDIVYHEDKQDIADHMNKADLEQKNIEKAARKAEEKAAREAKKAEKRAAKKAKGSESDKTISVSADTTTHKKDYSKYLFNERTYKKGRLVLAVVHQYVAEGKAKDFVELQNAFPKELQGIYGVVQLSSNVSDEDKGIGPDSHKRYFVKATETVKLSSGEVVLVSVDWGANNIDRFIQHATNVLGYTIDVE